MRRLLLARLLLVCVLLAPGSLLAEPGEEQRLAPLLVAAAARLRDTETAVAAEADQVAALEARQAASEAKLAQHAAALRPMLPVLERLALFPTETILAAPAPPVRAMQGLAVLRGLAHRLEADAEALRIEQARLAVERQSVTAALDRLRAIEADQAAQARALDKRMAEIQALRQRTDAQSQAASAQAAAAGARADTLRAAVNAIEAARARAETQARNDAARADRQRQDAAAAQARQRQEALARPVGAGPEPRGQMVVPVSGRVGRNWGEPTDAGPASGISFRPGPSARVVAPCGGRIRFAGPFRSYGTLIILDCGGGLATVLAGLGRTDVAAGTAVLAGEPVGVMTEFPSALYVEIRRDGQAVNPAPFLRPHG